METPSDGEQVNSRLRFLWDQYMRMVELLITLLTGTLAISAGFIKLGPRDAVAKRGLYAGGMISLLMALIGAVFWRILAQIFMEQEVFGNPASVAHYYRTERVVNPFTTSYQYNEQPIAEFFRFTAYGCMWLTAIGFLFGLGFLSLFAYQNLPEQNRPRVARRSKDRLRTVPPTGS